MTHSRTAIGELLRAGGLAPRRDLGQNFVADPNTVRKIAHLARVSAGDHVVEIGAGLGSLTLALAETGASIIAVEVDAGVVPVLTRAVADIDTVSVVAADAREIDWEGLLSSAPSWTLVANLPYNIATPLVCDILDGVPAITKMLVMVQREAGERFAAAPGTKQYGAVTVKVGYWADAAIVASVPASVFVPRPNVESVLVEITRHPTPVVSPPALAAYQPSPSELFALVRTAFGQRRKMLRRSLADTVAVDAFALAEIDPTRRPETLDVAEWLRLGAAANATVDGRRATNTAASTGDTR